ncbi:MAG: hypothetical protein JW909_03800 [Planctomycetes bacterium]|nr:hypothetical protein [Planctomycetota bacterium]
MPLPVSLIIDDGSCINPPYWLDPMHEHEMLIPNDFTAQFAEVCRKHGVRGKFSVMPMPSGTGRIDEKLSYVPEKLRKGFVRTVREKISPLFDVTIELLTHQAAYDIKSDRLMHVNEDEYVRRATVEELTDYIAYGFRIMNSAGIPAGGVTSPWATGRPVEEKYAEAIGRAFNRVYRKKRAWYFLHILHGRKARWPWIAWQDEKTGIKVATVPGHTGDPFWKTQDQKTRRSAETIAMRSVDEWLTENGKSGRLKELHDMGMPLVMVTHWQSLYSENRRAGLHGLEEAFRRINGTFGRTVEWTYFRDLAATAY